MNKRKCPNCDCADLIVRGQHVNDENEIINKYECVDCSTTFEINYG